MKIRSITFFVHPGWPPDNASILQAGVWMRRARQAYQQAGYEVQTTRLAVTPFPHLLAGLKGDEVVAAALTLERMAAEQDFAYLSLGPALLDVPESYELVPEIIAATENVFCSAQMTTPTHAVSIPAVYACARIISRLAPLDPNGFANLYFTALANVGPGSPFFPAAYHDGGQPAFALATEAASLAVDAFSEADSYEKGIEGLAFSLRSHAGSLSRLGEDLGSQGGPRFAGIDFSLAPFPDQAGSLGAALEHMGVPQVGMHGSLAAAAMLASLLDQVQFPRVGFSGLLFPQLEDAVLAERAASGTLTVKDLLMYSAVCGTGLDTIPLPGDTSPEQIAPLLLDLAALALRLNKPLTARLMPVPGKQAGELTSFNFPYFANSRVMALSAAPLEPPLSQADIITVLSRPPQS